MLTTMLLKVLPLHTEMMHSQSEHHSKMLFSTDAEEDDLNLEVALATPESRM